MAEEETSFMVKALSIKQAPDIVSFLTRELFNLTNNGLPKVTIDFKGFIYPEEDFWKEIHPNIESHIGNEMIQYCCRINNGKTALLLITGENIIKYVNRVTGLSLSWGSDKGTIRGEFKSPEDPNTSAYDPVYTPKNLEEAIKVRSCLEKYGLM